MGWLSRFRSSAQSFSDGSRLRFQHRFALRYFEDGRYVDIGFENAIGDPVDRLIHVWSAVEWRDINSDLRIGLISTVEREQVAQKVEQYCRERGLTYTRVEEEPTKE